MISFRVMGYLWCCISRITIEDVNFAKSVRPSLCPRVSGRLPNGRISVKFKIWYPYENLSGQSKTGKNIWHFT
jgi:hypothetical protein